MVSGLARVDRRVADFRDRIMLQPPEACSSLLGRANPGGAKVDLIPGSFAVPKIVASFYRLTPNSF
ncbi:hypothetical protein T281_03780 [Rhodomicrobium udaipurense JA643]|nr:hypothetical protein T281_03780 [Rhodomicrobium udaipurense JA643]